MLDFDKLQELLKMSSWSPVEEHARSAVYGASQIMSCIYITIENRIGDLINIKVTFDLDLGSHKQCQK